MSKVEAQEFLGMKENLDAARVLSRLPEAILFIALFCLAGYLLAFRLDLSPDSVIFWVCVSAALLALAFLAFSSAKSTQIWGLVGLLLLVWLLKSVFVPISVPFFGSDSYFELAATEVTEREGWTSLPPWAPEFEFAQSNERNYPLLAGLSIAFAKLSGLSLESWARWGMISLSLLSMLLVYAIAYSAYASRQTALLGAIGFGLTYYYLMFHSLYLRESVSVVLFLATIYAVMRSEKRGAVSYRIIGMAMVVGVVIGHHLTAFVLSAFMLLWFAVNSLYSEEQNREDLTRSRWSFVLYLLVVMLAYWIYLRYTPLRIAFALVADAQSENVTVSLAQAVPDTLRYYVLLALQFVSALGMGLLGLYGVYKYRAPNHRWQIASVIWGGGLGLLTLLGIVGALGKFGSFPSRMEVFGYAFLIPAAFYAVVQMRKQGRTLAMTLGIILLLTHATATLLRIQPYLYSDVAPDLAAREPRAVLLRQEYDLLMRVRPNLPGLVGQSYVRQAQATNLPAFFIEDAQDLSSSPVGPANYVIVGQLEHYQRPGLFDMELASADLHKVYDAGWAELYVPSSEPSRSVSAVLDMSKDGHAEPLTNPTDRDSPTTPWLGWILFAGLLLLIWAVGLGLIGTADASRAVGERNVVGDQVIGIAIGLLLLFTGFLAFDLTAGRFPFLLLVPIIIALFALLVVNRQRVLGLRSQSTPLNIHRFVVFFIFGVSILVGGVFDIAGVGARHEPYTEFYVQSPGDGQDGTMLVVTNRGLEPLQYHLEGRLAGREVVTVPDFVVQPGETWTWVLPLKLLPQESADQPVALELNLSTDEVGEPAHTLRLWTGGIDDSHGQ